MEKELFVRAEEVARELGICLTELKGYQAAVGQPVIQPRRPNNRLDKVRHMFQKVM